MLERHPQAALAVHELRVRLRHLGAQHAVGVRVGARATDLDDARALDGDGQTAGVGTIERADAGVFGLHGSQCCRPDAGAVK
jgi:hypothetical protein